MDETETAVARAIQDFEDEASDAEFLKIADYIRLLEGLQDTDAELPASMTLRWARKCAETNSNEQ
jgi:hypothetical protein